MFAIVKFTEESDSPGIVSSNWINKTRDKCHYPDVKTELQKNKLLLGRALPKPEWVECPIKVLREYATYDAAKEQLSEAELTSSLETDEGSNKWQNKKRLRKEKVMRLPGEQLTSSSEEEDHGRGKKSHPKHLVKEFPTPPPPPHFLTPSKPILIKPSSSSTSWPPITQPLTIDLMQSSSSLGRSSSSSSSPSSHASCPSGDPSSSNSSASSSYHGSDVRQIRGNQEMMWKVIGQLSQAEEELKKSVQRVEEKVDRMLSLLEDQPNRSLMESPRPTLGEPDLLTHLPVKVEDFEDFDEKLKEPTTKQRLVKYLLALGGKDVKALAANVMRRMFMDEIGEQYSLTGKAGKDGPGKKPFIQSESFRALYEICLRKFRHAEDSQVREAVSDWLMQAKFRKIRRENRRSRSAMPAVDFTPLDN